MIPAGVLADVLAMPMFEPSRRRLDNGYPLIHVSDLVNEFAGGVFCPRQYALQLQQGGARNRVTTSSMALLHSIGNALHEHVRARFMKNSEYAKYIWADWTCKCRYTRVVGLRTARICKRCRGPVSNYNEVEILYEELNLVGHPDLLLLKDDVFYVYEIKSTDKQDMPVEKIESPTITHRLQGSMYIDLLRRKGYTVHEKIRFLYASRGYTHLFSARKSPFKEIECLPVSPGVLIQYFDAAAAVRNYVINGGLPGRVCKTHTSAPSKQCEVVIPCFRLEN